MLELQSLSLSIAGKKICKEMNLTIANGECWAVLGQNGVGKTSFIRSLIDLFAPQNGEILLANKNIKNYSRTELARHIGLMQQDDECHFPLSVEEYVSHGRYPHVNSVMLSNEDKRIVTEALELAELGTLRKRKVNTLSGGEMRRTSFATLLAQTPELFLLDEPINHLDLRFQLKLLNHIHQLVKKQNRTAIIILHDVNMVLRYCENVILFWGEGKYSAGPSQELLTTENISRLYNYQMLETSVENGRLFYPT